MSYNSELQSNNTDLQTILETINNLPEAGGSGVELPTLTNPGTASDLAQGKQLIGADGNVITGSIREVFEGGRIQLEVNRSVYDEENNRFQFSDEFSSDFLCRAESGVIMNCDCDLFGNATPDQVAKGATFTSASGLTIEGTHECEEGVELPALENPGTADDLVKGLELIGSDGSVITGTMPITSSYNIGLSDTGDLSYDESYNRVVITDKHAAINGRWCLEKNATITKRIDAPRFGNATAADVAKGKTFTSAAGLLVEGEALLPGGGSVYPDGAFASVTNFTDGKQYALVATINGVHRYINTTTYNDYTMNATEITIAEDAGDYVIFGATPALFTAVASGDGFLLQNGDNYLHGTSSGGTALRFGTTQMVWTVDTSVTGGFSDGKYYEKEDANAVWLMNADGGYNWSIKYETAGSFGYDRDGRDGTYSTGFVSIILYEYVAGEGEVNPVVDTSDADAKSNDIVSGKTAYVNGRKIEGNVREINAAADYYVDDECGVNGKMISDTTASATFPMDQDTVFRKGTNVEFRFPVSQLGISTGSTIKTGTTTSATIATGLSSIEQFFIYKKSVSETGLIHLHYSSTDGTSYLYASAWSTSTWGSKTITNGTTATTVSGGSITLPSSTATSGGLSSGVTYTWVAIGK